MHMQKYYGIVEGFFSEPLPCWTHVERIETIRFIAEHCPHFNTYFYAPKSDPWVEQRPFELCPAKKLNELRETVEFCEEKKLMFVYGLNPAFPLAAVQRDFEGYVASITRKIFQLLSIGVRNFCILYDEIPFALNFDESKIRSEGDGYIGETHARILNSLLQRLEGKVNTLWFCPPDYSFSRTTPYLSALLKGLDNSIPIIWTGDGIFTKTISAEIMKKGRKVAGKKRDIIYWDNYPVNDCPHSSGTFHIGAFNAPSSAARRELKGILMNPMRECFANLIVYLTFEAYLKNSGTFERKRALYAAFRILFSEAWEPYARLYETFSDKNIVDDESRGYYADILQADSADIPQIVAAMKRDLEEVALPSTSVGRLFVHTTRSVLRRARGIQGIFSAMLLDKNWEEQFLLRDTFPVTLNKKYLTRQFTVFAKRIVLADALGSKRSPIITAIGEMSLLDRFSVPKEKPRTVLEKQLVNLFGIVIKYQQKNRLSITAQDTKKLFNILHALLPLERYFFLQQIEGLTATQKIQAFVRRSQINYY